MVLVGYPLVTEKNKDVLIVDRYNFTTNWIKSSLIRTVSSSLALRVILWVPAYIKSIVKKTYRQGINKVKTKAWIKYSL